MRANNSDEYMVFSENEKKIIFLESKVSKNSFNLSINSVFNCSKLFENSSKTY